MRLVKPLPGIPNLSTIIRLGETTYWHPKRLIIVEMLGMPVSGFTSLIIVEMLGMPVSGFTSLIIVETLGMPGSGFPKSYYCGEVWDARKWFHQSPQASPQ
jgi:hypothetical protein